MSLTAAHLGDDVITEGQRTFTRWVFFLYWLCESVTRNVMLGTPRNMQSLDLSKSRLHADQSCWANACTTAINGVIGFHAAKRTAIFCAQQKTYCWISNIMPDPRLQRKTGDI